MNSLDNKLFSPCIYILRCRFRPNTRCSNQSWLRLKSCLPDSRSCYNYFVGWITRSAYSEEKVPISRFRDIEIAGHGKFIELGDPNSLILGNEITVLAGGSSNRRLFDRRHRNWVKLDILFGLRLFEHGSLENAHFDPGKFLKNAAWFMPICSEWTFSQFCLFSHQYFEI